MRVSTYDEIIQTIINTKKKIFLWGCSERTKCFINEIKEFPIIIEGIIDTNFFNISDKTFQNISIREISFLESHNNSILIIHGNHCRSIFEQLKSLPYIKHIDVIFDFDNGAQKVFNRHIYVDYDYGILCNDSTNYEKLKLTTICEQNFLNNGGAFLVHLDKAEQVFPTDLIKQMHVDFLDIYVNNSKIYIGCGEDYRKGYIYCDKRALMHVDIVCNAWEIDTKIQNLSTIYSRHMLEHLTNKEAEFTLQNWYKALGKDGYVEIIVPNFDLRAKQWLSCTWEIDVPETEDEIWAVAGCWGWQRECDPLQDNYNQSYWDVHKSGYNEKRITKILSQIGFKDIVTKVDDKNNLIAIAYKR